VLPTQSGTGFAIFVLIWFLFLLLGFVAITVGLGRLVDRHVLDGPGVSRRRTGRRRLDLVGDAIR
jgi:hypothetical protein